MAAALTGAALAMLGVYAGLGLHDGFGDMDLHRVGRRFLRILPWLLCLSVPAGALLRAYYVRLLAGKPTGLGVLWTVVRAFAHFPLYGGVALLSAMAGFAAHGLSRLRRSLLGIDAPPTSGDEVLSAWLGPPIWFIVMPFDLMGIEGEGDIELPERVSTRRMLRWLPAILAMLMLWTGATGEDSGERVDPYWLAAFASYWLGDYVAVAWLVAPVMAARRRAE